MKQGEEFVLNSDVIERLMRESALVDWTKSIFLFVDEGSNDQTPKGVLRRLTQRRTSGFPS
jgi:hypothetical protein